MTQLHPVADYMTKQPFTIGRRVSIAKAHEIMRKHGIRHLPVLESRRVVGIVSVGDLHLLETIADFELAAVEVEEAMTADPYVVDRDTPVAEVAEAMARHKYGCAIVVDDQREVEGIFTTIDALRVLANMLWDLDVEQLATSLHQEST